HEEIQLLANDFSTMLMETLAHVPSWRDYYLTLDQTPHYEYLATQLKAMQFLRGGRRWLLKSPQHLEQLPVLDRVFPGLVVVCTHRDPVPVALSMLAMVAYSSRMYSASPPVREIGASWVNRLDLMLSALIRDREVIGAGRSMDIRFDDYMADQIGVAAKVYELAGEAMTGDDRAAIDRYIAEHKRNRFGRVQSSGEMFGVDEEDLRQRFAPYVRRFLN
ncbi:MAG TPA: sulfotransferase, partial [Mycobacterium sp.]